MAMQEPLAILSKYKIDYVFIPPEQPLAELLGRSPGWRPIYSDQVAVLFAHTPAESVPQSAVPK
jgi:hypothetical protein